MATEDSGLFGTTETGLFGREPDSSPTGAAAVPTPPQASPPAVPAPQPARRFGALFRALAAVTLVGLVGWLLTATIDDDSPESVARQSIADLNGYADVEVDLDGDVLTVSGEIPDDDGRRVVLAAVDGIDGISRVEDDLEVTRFAARPGDNLRAGLEADLDPAVQALSTTIGADDTGSDTDAAVSATTVAPQTTIAPETSSPATSSPATTSPATTSPATTSPATTAPPTTNAPSTTVPTTTTAAVTTTTFGAAEAQIAADDAIAMLGLDGVEVAVDADTASAVLTGQVETAADAEAAVAAVAAVAGVAGIDAVDDQLEVRSDETDSTDADGDDTTDSESEPDNDADDNDTDNSDTDDSDTDDEDASDEDASDEDASSDGSSDHASASEEEQIEAVSSAVESLEAESPVRFALGSAGLSDATRDELSTLAEVLIANPAATVEIAGHTCDLGPSDKNQRLSEQRAMSVADFLLSSGVGPGQIQTIGFGETQPAFDNDDPTQAAMNRRVEITVLR